MAGLRRGKRSRAQHAGLLAAAGTRLEQRDHRAREGGEAAIEAGREPLAIAALEMGPAATAAAGFRLPNGVRIEAGWSFPEAGLAKLLRVTARGEVMFGLAGDADLRRSSIPHDADHHSSPSPILDRLPAGIVIGLPRNHTSRPPPSALIGLLRNRDRLGQEYAIEPGDRANSLESVFRLDEDIEPTDS